VTPRVRVLHVVQPTVGGAAVVVENLLRDQRRRGWHVALACPAGPFAGRAEALGVEVRPWDADRSPGRGLIKDVVGVRRIIDELQPDVVHLHSSKAGLAGRLAVRRRVPTVFQPHGWSFNTVGTPLRLTSEWERLAGRWTDLLICVSEAELRDGRRRGVAAPAEVIVNGVELERFRPSGREVIRSRLAIDLAAPVAVCIGRVAAEKGQDQLLRAWLEVRRKVPQAQLLVVGDGPMKPGWRETIPGAGHQSVRWVGETSTPEDYLAAANVVVLPSRTEGMALVPLEAMASGRSVVAFDVGGTRDSVGVVGAGAVVAAGDVGALAAAVVTRLKDGALADAEGVLGRRRAELLFRSDDSAARVAAAAERLLLGKGRPPAPAVEQADEN
jgi:glycosyltransferase involved in cell wall biosynthesis